ncbi:hypothetical protein AB1Y20_011840 [Prymnesium parvum]|uniref:Uncharacterized protein n=1 Tax=Prymnesium parvum TaxID=97485 RepID=A0AB34IJA3_PRYPA
MRLLLAALLTAAAHAQLCPPSPPPSPPASSAPRDLLMLALGALLGASLALLLRWRCSRRSTRPAATQTDGSSLTRPSLRLPPPPPPPPLLFSLASPLPPPPLLIRYAPRPRPPHAAACCQTSAPRGEDKATQAEARRAALVERRG